ncbi:MAG: tetratricopeptide repeat protein [Chloroflexi bacterium]|nr:tetratricopeptide repeat protein [Chloroflexota bacterium]
MSIFQQITEEEVSRVLNAFGIVYLRLGKVDKRIVAYEKALPLARQTGLMETAVALSNLGEAYQLLYDMEQAFVYHNETMSIAETIQIISMEVDTRRNLGVDLTHLGEMEAGIVHLRQSLQMSEAIGEPHLTHQALYSLALAEQVHGQNDEAETIANRLLQSAERNQAGDFQAQAMYVLGLCAQIRDNVVIAEQIWQQALFLAHETGQQNLLWQLHAALAEIAPNPALATTHYRIAQDVIDQIVYPIDDNALRQKFLKAPPVKAILDQVA